MPPEISSSTEKESNKDWNYHPELPLYNPSVFQWPLKPSYLISWFASNWLTLSERVLLVLVAILLWVFCYPSLETTKEIAPGWIIQIFVVNLVLHCLVAGSLHWYFYIKKGQANELKFDHRSMGLNNRLWSFSNQVKDNIFWSVASGIPQLSIFQILTMWLMANGFAPVIQPMDHPVWFLAVLVLIPMWSAFHFYWVHRWLHQPWLYRKVHSLHHRNVNIGPWSGLSMHPLEHLLYFSSLCIHWFLASHPIHVFFHVIYLGPGAAMTHTGYEDLLIKDKRRLGLGTFYHQLHHRHFKCNYGNQEMPLDRWFGTFHDGTHEATARVRSIGKRS